MTLLLGNAFSLNMLDATEVTNLSVKPLSLEEARQALSSGFTSVVGHSSTSCLFSSLLELDVETARATVKLERGVQLLVGQYSGPRLDEGVTTLPDGATLVWLLVELA